MSIRTFADICRRQADSAGDSTAYWLSDGDVETARVTFTEIDAAARKVAHALTARRLFGERVVLLFESGLDFIQSFYGCLYSGAIAVPVNMPSRRKRVEKILTIAADCGATIALTSAELRTSLQADGLTLECVCLNELLGEVANDNAVSARIVQPQQPAFLQYTSGSTGAPKGVIVSHENLVCNQQMIREGFGHDSTTVFASWLPLFHDMGLVGNMLQPMYLGIPAALMPPAAFIQQPVRWLRMISHYRATTSGAPNFAYELCLRRIRDADMEGIDLSSWSLAFNGAEPIQAATLERFAEKFAPYGFRQSASFPCYGMAETTLFVTGRRLSEPVKCFNADAGALALGTARAAQTDGSEPTRALISCGIATAEQRVIIVDPSSQRTCTEDAVGEIWIAGPHVALGYWNKPDVTEQTFHAYTAEGSGPFLRTGDLGFVHDSELYVTGRIKDVIIVAGKNHYPQDLERSVSACHPAFDGRIGAAVSVAAEGGEELAIVQEISAGCVTDLSGSQLRARVRAAVFEDHGLFAKHVVLVKPGSVPLTSSGKVQRSACAKMFNNQQLDDVLLAAGE
jgi:acyl-CoA synthetase (AMP-forming)/AMP-acid ligase II